MTKNAHSTIATDALIVMKQKTSRTVESRLLSDQADCASFIVDDTTLLSKFFVNSLAVTGLPNR